MICKTEYGLNLAATLYPDKHNVPGLLLEKKPQRFLPTEEKAEQETELWLSCLLQLGLFPGNVLLFPRNSVRGIL